MSTILVSILLIIMTACSLKYYLVRLSAGCCGGAGQPYIPKVRVQDHNRSHYPYFKILRVGGMSGGNSAVCVENALNSIDGVWAKVNLMKEEVSLFMKQDLEEAVLRAALRDAGYVLLQNNPITYSR